MREEIRRIHQETGVTMIYVTHDQKEALTMADRIAVMSMGRVEQVGTPQDLYRSPANVFVATFLGEANLIRGELVEVTGGSGMIRTPLGNFRGRLARPDMSGGETAWCMVRPENLRLSVPGENQIPVLVKDTLFLGESEQFLLQADGMPLKALAVGAAGRIAKGQRLGAAFAPEDALILPLSGPLTGPSAGPRTGEAST